MSASLKLPRLAVRPEAIWSLAPMPLAIGAVLVAAHWGFRIPNVPPALLLPLAYSAYRGGLMVGLVAAALHVFYSALFFSEPGAPFHYDAQNFVRILVVAVVAPTMAMMIGLLRKKADQSLRQVEASKRDLLSLTVELERRVEERTAELVKLARSDSMTGIANRAALGEQLEAALDEVRRLQQPFAIFFLDIDGFKHINDTLGHAAGDSLLRTLAQRLTAAVGAADFVARLGGDEFAIIQRGGVDLRQSAIDLARRVLVVVNEPVELCGRSIVVGTSIGIAMAPADGTDAGALLKCADLALYRVKATGKNNFCFFEIGMSQASEERQQKLGDLRQALERGEFEVHYQPVIDARTGLICAVEALVRWRHPVRGLMAPDRFIPLAEETGLMAPLGKWVLEQSCRDAMAWPAHIKVAVNLSTIQLTDALFGIVANALQQSGLAAERLELEITESVLMKDIEQNAVIFQRLQEAGVSIVLDDFGVGYSSLSYLTMLRFDKIKIDKSFTQGLADNVGCQAGVAAILTLAKHLDMLVTAEGVETIEQVRLLRETGVDQLQGYLFARPAAAADLNFLPVDVRRAVVAA